MTEKRLQRSFSSFQSADFGEKDTCTRLEKVASKIRFLDARYDPEHNVPAQPQISYADQYLMESVIELAAICEEQQHQIDALRRVISEAGAGWEEKLSFVEGGLI